MKNLKKSFVLLCLALLFCVSLVSQAIALSGTLTVYSPHGPELTGPILEKFAEAYPDVKVQLIKAGTGELLARLRAEKGNPAADVMWGGVNHPV